MVQVTEIGIYNRIHRYFYRPTYWKSRYGSHIYTHNMLGCYLVKCVIMCDTGI